MKQEKNNGRNATETTTNGLGVLKNQELWLSKWECIETRESIKFIVITSMNMWY